MLNKRAHTLIAFLFLLMPAYAAPDKEIKELGHIWVVTVDKSGSMLTKTTPSLLGESVEKRLLKGDALDKADFSKDRFLFYTSGISFDAGNGMGNELRRAAPFDRSFIHATDGKLHSFSDKNSCAAYIRRIIEKGNYSHRLSFVSQIRLFSIVKAVNDLKTMGEQDNYNQLMVLTITDDADQNDQWATDYRTLKQAAPNKLQQVNDSTAKYLYNSLNGKGLGSLDCIYSEEKEIPHLWVYEYRTLASMVPEQERDVFSITASNGQTVSVRAHESQLDGDEICFYALDSILVNQSVLRITNSEPFAQKASFTGSYDNTYKKNRVTLWGHVQVKYQDPVLGKHYKTIPFVQKESVFSRKCKTLIWVFSIFMAVLILGSLAWLFFIRPRTKLFTIYSGLGTITTVQRGFARSWKGNQIPIQCYEGEPGKFPFGCFSRKGKYIKTSCFQTNLNVEADDVLICAHTPLQLSVDVPCQSIDDIRVEIDTGKNIKEVSRTHTGQYPPLLQHVYQGTLFYRFYEKDTFFSRLALWILNRFGKLYFYHIPSITQASKVYFCAHRVYGQKGFIIDFQSSHPCDDHVAGRALAQYYTHDSIPPADILVCCCKGEQNQWRIIRLEDSSLPVHSLRYVKNHIRFTQGDTTSPALLFPAFRSMLKKLYPQAKVGFVICSSADDIPYSFSVRDASAPGFISYVEGTQERKSQLLYSPFEDGDSTEKGIQLNPDLQDGHLFLSAVPFSMAENHSEALTQKLSQHLFYNSRVLFNILKLEKDSLSFKGETIKYQ